MHRRIGLLVAGLTCTTGLLATAGPAASAPPPNPTPLDLSTVQVDESLRRARGPVEVIVRLSEPSLGAVLAEDALTTGQVPDQASQQTQLARVKSQQDGILSTARALGGREKGRVSKSLNAVAVRIDASRIDELAAVPGVVSVRPVARYHTTQGAPASGSLAQAAVYLGADKVRAAGFDGTGVRVAVLDSGVDFTHRNLGGPGTEAVYDTCYAQNAQLPSGPCAALFGPSAPKVKGGYDFVGETWTGEEADGPEVPDPNPIDLEGHGTHVSDIIGGRSADGAHLGIAPGVDLYGVKVCSAVSTACSNIAILQGIDWALDPNNDGDIRDAVDLVNLSLGSDYGQPEDDSTLAVNEAAKLGVTMVVSAGNGGDQPFKVGSPSTAPRAISVAQTSMPDASSIPIQVTSPAGIPTINLTTLVSWSPAPTSAIRAALRRPSPSPLGCAAADFAGFPAGAVALIDRGTCNVSLKSQLAQAAGASAVVLRNNVAGAPPDFSFGGGVPVVIPTLVVGRTPGTTLVNAVTAGPVQVLIDPAAAQSLRGTIAGTSSRGPVQQFNTIKPDIGAPGAWESAEAGTGSGETAFGGTSGAAPTVSGVAALVLDRFPRLAPPRVKARLLNAADTGNLSLTEQGQRYPTPVTRIGAGEVRAEAAVFATYTLEADDKASGNLSIGLPHLAKKETFSQKVTIRNTDSVPHTYTLAPSFRDPADAALQALNIQVPNGVVVGPGSARQVTVKFTVDPSRLTPWPLTGLAGVTGEDAIVLNGPELDGWITATCDSGERTHLGWQVLPHRSADASAQSSNVRTAGGRGELQLRNASKVLDAGVEVFSLTGTSPKNNNVPAPGSNESRVDLLAVGVRDLTTDDGTPLIEFAFHGAGRKSTPGLPAEYDIDLDVDGDGTPEFNIFNALLSTGQTGTVVADGTTFEPIAIFLSTVADYDSANLSYFLPLGVLGLAPGDTFDFTATAYQNYFVFAPEDTIPGMSYTVGQPKYSVAEGPTVVVPAGQRARFTVEADTAASSSEQGLLLLYNNAAKTEAEAIRVRS